MSLHEEGARFPLKLMFWWVNMGGMHAGKQSKSALSLD